jgi:4-amino-4-deoxy-L-arabinose transferase-like glycosyltransferase
MTSYKKAWWAALAVKLLIAAMIPLSADEAYYWVWSQFPQLSYFDHPPMVAWLFQLGSFLPHLLVRWPGVVLFHLGFLFWFHILKSQLSEKQILNWFILCLLCPLMGLGTVLILPDSPLFFFFSAALYFFIQALKNPRFKNYAAFGALLGLGFLSKYLIVIPAALFFVDVLVEKDYRHLKIKNLATTVFCGLLFSLPVLIWNWRNDFKSFGFQLHHGLAEGSWHWHWTTDYLLGTLLLLFPYNLYAAFKTPSRGHSKLFAVLSGGGFLFFLLSSFKGSVELNWPSIFFPPLFALSVQWQVHEGSASAERALLKNNLIYWGLIYFLIGALAGFHLIPDLERKLHEPYQAAGWTDLPRTYSPLYSSTYQLASLMWWNSQRPVFKLKGSSRYDFFDELAVSQPEGNIFYLLKEKGNNLPDWLQNGLWAIEEVQNLDENHIVLKISKKDRP